MASPETDPSEDPDEGDEPESVEELRRRVEAEYDFENFGPAEMDRMSAEEWEAVFDPETWITGPDLLDRVEADLKQRIADRDVFARVERVPDPDRVVAYSDEGYAVVREDGSVTGSGTVLRDVKPTVALSSMAEYDVPEPPEGEVLPRPMDVPEGSGEFGNLMIQLVAAAQVLAGLALVATGLVTGAGPIVLVAGLGFLVVGVFLFVTVANARLSDRFRAEEYRNRLRAVGIGDDDDDAADGDADLPAELEAALGRDPGENRRDDSA